MLLRRSDIDAAPALVGTYYRKGVKDRLPSPDIFNHSIVQIKLGDEIYWLDPTRSGQRGPLSQIYGGNYGCALVLRSGTNELTAFEPPRESWPRKKIVETYMVPAPEQPGELRVVSEYHGLAADRTRSSFQENTREEIQKHYVEYYARSFPAIKTSKELSYEEIKGENGCRVTETYTIPQIWQLNEDKTKYELVFRPAEIEHAVGTAPSPQRDDPVSLDYPNSIIEEINADMFEEWPLNVENQSIANDYFRFRNEATDQNRRLTVTFSYETLADRVPPAGFPKYNADLEKVEDALGYHISYSTPAQLKSIYNWRGFNWPIAVALVAVISAASYASYRYFRRTKLPSPLPPPIPSGVNPLPGCSSSSCSLPISCNKAPASASS